MFGRRAMLASVLRIVWCGAEFETQTRLLPSLNPAISLPSTYFSKMQLDKVIIRNLPFYLIKKKPL
jgi:hypothetical protein